MKKKAHLMDIFIWMIVGFIVLLFLATWVYGWGLMTDTMTDIGMIGRNNSVNVSKAAEDTFGAINRTNLGWHIVAFAVIFAMAISILISNFLIKAHPVFFGLYIFVVVLAIVFSAFLSNSYENIMTNLVIGETLSGFKAGSYIMLNLPLWTAIIGIFGAIFLFIGILRDRGAGGSVI